MLQNDILTPLLLMREELRPTHRLRHTQQREDDRTTIRHSPLYIAAAQKYYNKDFRNSSWFRAAVQRYSSQRVPTTPAVTTHKHPSENGHHNGTKRKLSAIHKSDFLSSPRKRRVATPSLVADIPERLATSPPPPFNPLDYNGFLSDDDIKFKAIVTRTQDDPSTRRLPTIGSSNISQEVIEITDSESVDDIDWDDQVPFTIIFWTSVRSSFSSEALGTKSNL